MLGSCVHGDEPSESVNFVGCYYLFGCLSATHRLFSIGVAVRSFFVKGGSLVYKADSYVEQFQLSYC